MPPPPSRTCYKPDPSGARVKNAPFLNRRDEIDRFQKLFGNVNVIYVVKVMIV